MKIVPKKAFVKGKIFTCDDSNPWAETVVTLGNKTLFVGSDEESKKYIDSDTQVIDLNGKLMLPGFIDSHLHFMNGGFSLLNVDLQNVKSKSEFRNEIQKFIQAKNPTWITGGNWDHQQFDEKVLPSKEWVDTITGNVPLFVTRSDLHMGLANSKALQLAGINKDTSDPAGGVIQRNKSGEPTGILIDNAMQKVIDLIHEPTLEERKFALRAALNEAKKFGITSVHDIVYPKDYTIYEEFMRDEKLTCRVNLVRPISEVDEFVKRKIQHAHGDEYLKVGSLKGFADGSLGSSTAWFYEPYADDSESIGLPTDTLADGRLRKWAIEADKNKLQLVIHAIGDKAISAVLDIFEEIERINPLWDRRWRIEHVQHIRKEDIARMKKLNVIASVQPYHLYYDGVWCESKVGAERIPGSYTFKSLIDGGVKLCCGSDWTVVSPNPLLGTFAAVTRLVKGQKDGEGWIPSEKISVVDAIKGYTINSAFASFEESIKGSIEAGKLADFVILSENIFEINPKEISTVIIEKTVFDGEIIYEK